MAEQQTAPGTFFKQQVSHYEQQLTQTQKSIRRVGTLRISVFLITVLGIYLTAGHSLTAVLTVAVAGFSLFGFFVFRHIRLYKQKKRVESLLQINENELRLLNRDTSHQPDGHEFLDAEHPFVADLDIFGKRSLFQLLDRSATHIGRKHLALTLLYPPKQKEQIKERQEAIAELSGIPRWRQAFQALGNTGGKDKNAAENLLDWAKNTETVFNKPIYKILLIITPLLGFTLMALNIFGVLSFAGFLTFLLLPLLVLGPKLTQINNVYERLSKKTALLEQYASLFEKTEEKAFGSKIMKEAEKTLVEGETSAFKAVRQLSGISKAFDYRLNMFAGFFLNIFFLWDIRQSMRLEKWKNSYGNRLSQWLETLAQVDELCSFAGFAFQHPEAVFPEIATEGLRVQGKNLKHPFIDPAVCVGNPVNIDDRGRFHVITGANMAGKSTYLRTVGINLILAECGAPVLADFFEFSPIQVFTGIKTTDSLQDGASYFFAELQRLKEIMDRLRAGEKLFIILDEILRGTNSKDKQKGSKALLRQFLHYNTSGLIATHDLALGDLAGEFPEQIVNKRFEVEIHNNEMAFDYTLKEGISQILNATFLLKKMKITEEEV
ncbi:MAG: DNA mismatch repair protein MutS [bacterium]|nr:MAG: DNA mismatch repair protein MutS [bacterium]